MAREVVDLNSAFRLQQRTLKTGEVRSSNYRVDFSASPLYVSLDAEGANQMVADVLREIVRREIKNVTEVASDATLKRRERYAREAAGATRTERTTKTGRTSKSTTGTSRAYLTRYSGGRIGEVPPSGSVRLFNDSGRFADYLVLKVRKRSTGESVITLDCAGNRLDPRTFGGGDAALQQYVIPRLQQHVPSLSGRMRGQAAVEFDKMLNEVAELAVAASDAERQRHEARLRALQMRILRDLASLLV